MVSENRISLSRQTFKAATCKEQQLDVSGHTKQVFLFSLRERGDPARRNRQKEDVSSFEKTRAQNSDRERLEKTLQRQVQISVPKTRRLGNGEVYVHLRRIRVIIEKYLRDTDHTKQKQPSQEYEKKDFFSRLCRRMQEENRNLQRRDSFQSLGS